MGRLSFVCFTFICCAANAEQVAILANVRPRDALQQQESNPLNGEHFRLIASPLPGIYNVKRNSTGYVVQSAGPVPLALEWLSLRYNFTYSYIPMTEPNMVVDELPNQEGGMTFLRQKEAELYLGALVVTSERFKDADFPSPWMSSSFSILIPIPNSSTNIGALIQPMSTEVWIWICLSVPAVMASLFGLSKCIVALNKRMMHGSKPSDVNLRDSSFQITNYVICVLLSQGA
ncbi:hypothetical protein DAPPUDRAFT_115497 [Daphnia pulex]|uniref:Ionotropic glutamate receptor L-glutamate and glycine-binding domain-containing protein n=1 Tax=Daphnia pulex TaxID=6669 RepID=E9HLK7_DAPPU|nr:hypothetical protein DAPPUDRAFT_115497 [Daphnia pulex]|eukprot:EFX67399.1 hypothetical protein DAPPUDRAFT_115497 [Daphnia pulex]